MTDIGNFVFAGNTSLTSVFIGSGVKKIFDNTFYGCTGLKSVMIPSSVTEIGNYAFGNCEHLDSVTIPNGVEIIGRSAFSGCGNLTSIVIPQSVKTIGSSAFRNCKSLTSVTIGDSVVSMETLTFYESDNIQKIYCYATDPPYISGRFCFSNYNAILYVPLLSVSKYKNSEDWKRFKIANSLKLTAKRDFFGEVSDTKEMRGVTADGVSQLNVVCPLEDGMSLGNVRAVFKVNGEECTDKEIIGTYSDIQKMSSGWGLVYTAPEDFPTSVKGNEYTIDVEFLTEENDLVAVVGGAQIKVYRPGVLLLHGLGGSGDTFEYLRNYLKNHGGYQPFQIVNGDYRMSNTDSFEDNMYENKVVQMRLKQLYNQFYDKGIVSSKYDLVGHSMGGILSRLYAQEVNVDGVNRIITMNTPHSGSSLGTLFGPLMTTLVEMKQAFEEMGLDLLDEKLMAQYLAIKTLEQIFQKSNNAVADLSPSSEAIARLNAESSLNTLKGKVPVHAIGSYMTDAELSLRQNASYVIEPMTLLYDVLSFLIDEASSQMAAGFWDGAEHDGVVPLESQLGGLSDLYTSVVSAPYSGWRGQKSQAYHSNVHHWSVVCDIVRNLLWSSKSSSSFSMEGFHPVDMSGNTSGGKKRALLHVLRQLQFAKASDSSFIEVEATKEESRELHLQLNQSEDIVHNLVFVSLYDEQMILERDTLTASFIIPDTFEGDLIVYALGKTRDNALVADTLMVTYESGAKLNYLVFQDRPHVSMTVGQEMVPNVLGGWNNGDEWYIMPEYTTTPTGILEIDNGVVKAMAEGECLLTASYAGLFDVLNVKVGTNIITGIEAVDAPQPAIQYVNGKILVTPSTSSNGMMTIDIYDLKGKVCEQQRRNISVQSGVPETIELSNLAPGIYLAKVSGPWGYSLLKFYLK